MSETKLSPEYYIQDFRITLQLDIAWYKLLLEEMKGDNKYYIKGVIDAYQAILNSQDGKPAIIQLPGGNTNE